VRKNNRNIPWWTQDLAERRRKVRRLFNAAKKSGNWTDCKRILTEYNKALRQARLHRILSKGGQSSISSFQLENGEYTTTEKGTLEELLRVHFPSSEIISEPSRGWNGLELEFPKWKGSRGRLGGSQKGYVIIN
jgi:hypothetical protein